MEKAVNKKSSINIVIYFHCISAAVDNIPVSCGWEHFVPICRRAARAGPGRGGLVLEQPGVHHRQVTSTLELGRGAGLKALWGPFQFAWNVVRMQRNQMTSWWEVLRRDWKDAEEMEEEGWQKRFLMRAEAGQGCEGQVCWREQGWAGGNGAWAGVGTAPPTEKGFMGHTEEVRADLGWQGSALPWEKL